MLCEFIANEVQRYSRTSVTFIKTIYYAGRLVEFAKTEWWEMILYFYLKLSCAGIINFP